MEEKISVGDLIIKKIDETREQKNSLETKAFGYLTVVSLLLTLLFNNNDSHFCLYVELLFFGFVILVLCAAIFFPKDISFFKLDILWKMYKDEYEYDEKMIVEAAKIIVENNEKTLRVMNKLNWIVSRLLMLFIVFVIVFFIHYFTEK